MKMPAGAPTPAALARVVPMAVRYASTSAASTSKPPPDKSRHVLTYPPEAFPRGFKVSSVAAGIKKKAGALDLGILVSTSPTPCAAAACLTKNVFKAAPVSVTADLLNRHGGRAKAFVVNAGCANAVTGRQGLEDAWTMSQSVTHHLGAGEKGAAKKEAGTLVMSTGVIGQLLPIDKITDKIPSLTKSLSDTPEAWMDLAKAFMTTDTFPKLRTRSFTLGGRTIRMAGIDKGAGMIAPNMGPPPPPHATLLGVIVTDAPVSPPALQSALNYAVEKSFNSITVDGDMSTNDTILAFANGAAGASAVSKGEPERQAGVKELDESDPDFPVFQEELRGMAEDLAQLVARDGEGATKFVTVRVVVCPSPTSVGEADFPNAPNEQVAKAVAKSVASSSLVKCALYGEDANWGRVLCAVGYTDLPEGTISPDRVTVQFVPAASAPNQDILKLLTNGEPESNIDEARASEILAEEDLEVLVDLGSGNAEAKVWTCDFSHDYVTINGSYRS